MGSEWNSSLIEEAPLQIEDGDRGKNYPKRAEFMEAGHCVFLNTGNVTQSGFDLSELDFISEERDQLLRKGKLRRKDIVLTTRGTVGNVAYFDEAIPYEHIRINSGMVIIRPDTGFLEPRYVYLFLRSRLFSSQVDALRTGSAQPQLPIRDIKKIRLTFPPLSEQKAIAHILGTLDDKIDLNRQMNATLEAMAQALFKSWFVDFDPVIDNALAAGNPIPEPLQKRKGEGARVKGERGTERSPFTLHHSLFPDRFVFSEEMGWVPEGWGSKPVYDVAKFINGAAFKSKHFSPDKLGLPVVKIAEIKNGLSTQTKYTTEEFDRKYMIGNGDILFSWSGNPDTSIDTFLWSNGEGWLNQHIFKVVVGAEFERTFVFYLLKHLKPTFAEIARDKQTTGLGHVTAGDMKRLMIPFATKDLLQIFDRQAGPLLDNWYNNVMESQSLSRLRDTLLPKLLSGELRIPDAEKLVEVL